MKDDIATPRIILRIEVTPAAVQGLRTASDCFGMKHVAVTSRLVMWVVDQPETLQAMILGLHPESAARNIPSEVALSIAAMVKRS